MATKLYLRSTGQHLGPMQTNTGDAGATGGGSASQNALMTSKGAGTTSLGNCNTAAGPTAGVPYCTFVSAPLAAAATISGTVTFNIWASESSMNANVNLRGQVYRIQPDGTATQILDVGQAAATELSTTVAVNNWTGTPTSTSFAKGDHIMVRILGDDGGSANMASGFTFQVQMNGTTDGASGDTYVQFNENLTFTETTPAGTTLYLSSTASSVTVSGEDERQLVTADPGTGSTSTSTTNTVNGPTSGVKVTASAGASDYLAWYSDTFAVGATLTGPLSLRIEDGIESSLSANAAFRYEVYVCNGDGTSPTQIASILVMTFELLAASPVDSEGWVGIPDTAVSAGQRLMVRVLVDDAQRWGTAQNLATGFTASFIYNTTGSRITLQETPTFGAPRVVKAAPYPQMIGR